jgi:hypothetical protein
MPVGFYKPFGMGTRLAKSLSVFPRRRPITKANPVVASGQPVLPSRRYTPHMADWLILLLKYGGFGAVMVAALFRNGKVAPQTDHRRLGFLHHGIPSTEGGD